MIRLSNYRIGSLEETPVRGTSFANDPRLAKVAELEKVLTTARNINKFKGDRK